MPALTQKGQVTIPIKIRKFLKLKRGDDVGFSITEDGVKVIKRERKSDFNKYVGFLNNQKDKTSDQVVAELRDE